MGLVDYILRHPNQKAKKVSAYDEEFILANLKLNSASVNSLNLNTSEPVSPLIKSIQALDPAHQIKPKTGAIDKAINLLSTRAALVHKHARPKCQLSLHSLGKIHLIVNTHSKTGMKDTSPSARLNLLSLISRN